MYFIRYSLKKHHTPGLADNKMKKIMLEIIEVSITSSAHAGNKDRIKFVSSI